MLEVTGIDVFYGGLKALDQVTFDVKEGEFVALIGSNGSGKSTLLNAIAGLITPQKGTITFNGVKIDGAQPSTILEKGIVLVPEGRALFPQMSVMENLLMGAYPTRTRGTYKCALEQVFSYFPRLYERKNQESQTMSGGEQQMLAIGRGLMSQPRLLMLDELSLGLAPKIVMDICAILQRMHKDNEVTIVLSEQNIYHALQLANRGVVLENGKVTLTGSSEELLCDDNVKNTYMGL